MSSNAQFKSLSISLYRDIPQTDQISSPFHIKFVGDTIKPVQNLSCLGSHTVTVLYVMA